MLFIAALFVPLSYLEDLSTFLHSVQVFDLDIFHEIFCFLLTLAIEFQEFLSNSKLFIQKLTIE